ncbi:MAG: RnfABCDGE type electron transport complex subunit D [Candidatus Pacebacteria bacterium]|nr:RnfABCDGE type electron transport complex subunit D [Candidatus Paceibacterota bacterium]MDR3582870.1 RnfABCDGE type electron transport complex subunit D [Candidatus Paceibacterota bacterium]
MFNFIDKILNRITMYRLVLYYLLGIWLIALGLAFFGILPLSPLAMIVSLGFILAVSWIANVIFARIFAVPTNAESYFITALILALIISPLSPSSGFDYLWFMAFAALWAIASKFILAIRGKHIFNPAAAAVVLTAATVGQSASWWIGNAYLALPVFLGGLLIVRKIRRTDLAISFFAAAAASIVLPGLARGTDLWTILNNTLFHSPLLFFAFVMLTEPLTTPPRRTGRIFYGVLVGILFSPAFHLGSLYLTPELALIIGNIFSYIISPKQKLILRLEEIFPLGPDLWELVFASDKKFNFRPGQYLEWTMGQDKPDRNGNRRYFTIASSPTENRLRIGVKGNNGKSSFKQALLGMKRGDTIVASQLAGDFTLPKDKGEKLVFIAGGIGITPFRSMIKYMLDREERRDAILFYSSKTPQELAYRNIFDSAAQLGIRTIYSATEQKTPSLAWCQRGRIDDQAICSELPDFRERTYFISGPQGMVTGYKKMLRGLGIPARQIKTDYFPGFV